MDDKETVTKRITEVPQTLHTYTGDMADVVRENQMSVIKIALAEQEKKQDQESYALQNTDIPFIQKYKLVLIGIVIIIVGSVIAYSAFKKKIDNTTPLRIQKDIQTLIPYDTSMSMIIQDTTTQQDIITAIQKEKMRTGVHSGITALFLKKQTDTTEGPLSFSELTAALKLSMPRTLATSLSDNYLIGIYRSSNTTRRPMLFFLFQTKEYTASYAGLLSWEQTMLDDFYQLFAIDVSGDKKILFSRPWKDILIDNRDARILYDTDGTDILYYSFIDRNNFIITEDQETIREVIDRTVTATAKPI